MASSRKNPHPANYTPRQKEQMAPPAYLLNQARLPGDIANLERLQRERPLAPPRRKR